MKFINNKKASILIVVMIFMVALVGLAIVFLNTVNNSATVSSNQVEVASALYLAEAGANKGVWYLQNTAPDGTTNASWRTANWSSAYLVTPYSGSLWVEGSGSYTSTYPVQGNLNNGTYTIWVQNSSLGGSNNITITSTGTFNGVSKTVQIQGLIGPSPTNGLVGWWKLNGNLNDSNPNNSPDNGTFEGGSPSYVLDQLGNTNGALSFNGTSQYVDVPNTSNLNITGNISVSAWVYMNSLNNERFVAKWDGSSSWILEISGNYLFWVNAPGSGTVNASTGTGVAINQWHHLVGTYDGDNIKIYVDGTLQGSTSQSGAISSNSHDVYFGTGEGANTQWLNGNLDDVRIYNRALSATEIQELYQGDSVSIIPGSEQVLQ